MNSVEIEGKMIGSNEATIFVNTSDCPAESDDELEIVVEYTDGIQKSREIGFEMNSDLQILLPELQPSTTYDYTVFVRRKNDSFVIGVKRTGRFITGELQCMLFVNQLIVCKSHVGSWRVLLAEFSPLDEDEVPTLVPVGAVVGGVCGVYFGFYGGVMSGSASNMYRILPRVAGGCGLHVQHAVFACSTTCTELTTHPHVSLLLTPLHPPHSTPSSSPHSILLTPLHPPHPIPSSSPHSLLLTPLPPPHPTPSSSPHSLLLTPLHPPHPTPSSSLHSILLTPLPPPHSTPSSSLHSVACIPLHLVPYSSPAGLSGSLVVLMAVGMITSIALFPIGIVLLIVTCCCCHGNKSSDESYDSSYHNPTSKCDRHSC